MLEMMGLLLHAGTDAAAEVLEALVELGELGGGDVGDVGHEVGDVAARVGHLLVDVVAAEDLVDAAQHAGHVVVDVDDAGVVGLVVGEGAERDLGQVDGAGGAAAVDVLDQRLGDLDADGRLRLLRRAADVRRQQHVGRAAQVRGPGVECGVEVRPIAAGLVGVDVERGAGEVAGLQGRDERGDVDGAAARRVEQVGALAHERELRGRDHVHGLRELGDVQGDEVGGLQQLLEAVDLRGAAHAHEVDDVEIDDPHAHGLGQHRQLTAHVSIPDDAQRLAAHLPAPARHLVPHALVHLVAAVADLAGEGDDLPDHHLRDGARVAEGRVEHGDAVCGSIFEVDLVRTDAEAADDDQVLGVLEDAVGEMCLGADADDVHVPDLLDQLVLRERTLEGFDLVALLGEDVAAGLVDVLEQQDLDVLGVERLQLFGRGRLGATVTGRAVIAQGMGVEGVGDGARDVVAGAVAVVDGDVAGGRRHGGGDGGRTTTVDPSGAMEGRRGE
nr:hypothetical protein CFP56_33547 [Quercus suber]